MDDSATGFRAAGLGAEVEPMTWSVGEGASPLDASLDLRIPIEPGNDHRWFVIAFDADGEILAISEEHPLAG